MDEALEDLICALSSFDPEDLLERSMEPSDNNHSENTQQEHDIGSAPKAGQLELNTVATPMESLDATVAEKSAACLTNSTRKVVVGLVVQEDSQVAAVLTTIEAVPAAPSTFEQPCVSQEHTLGEKLADGSGEVTVGLVVQPDGLVSVAIHPKQAEPQTQVAGSGRGAGREQVAVQLSVTEQDQYVSVQLAAVSAAST